MIGLALCILVNIASQTNGSVAVSEVDTALNVAGNSDLPADLPVHPRHQAHQARTFRAALQASRLGTILAGSTTASAAHARGSGEGRPSAEITTGA